MRRKCKECDEELFGRIDKKFCSDQCRNTFNNKLNYHSQKTVRKVNRILSNNRRILIGLNRTGGLIISEKSLTQLGFRMNYSTGQKSTGNNQIKYYYYDQCLEYHGVDKYILKGDYTRDVESSHS